MLGTAGSSATIDVAIYHSDTNVASDAVAVTNTAGTALTFSQKATAQDGLNYVGRLQLVNMKRYLFIRVVVGTNTSTFAVGVELTDAINEPVTQTQAVAFTG